MQSTFLNAFRGFKRGVDPEFESAWLYKIAQNVCLTRQRSSSRRRRVESPGDLDAIQDILPSHEVDSDELIGLPEALAGTAEAAAARAAPARVAGPLVQGDRRRARPDAGGRRDAALPRAALARRRARATSGQGQERRQQAARRHRRRLAARARCRALLSFGGAKVAATVATVAATSVVASTPTARHAVEHAVVPSKPQHVAPAAHVTKPHATQSAVAERRQRRASVAHAERLWQSTSAASAAPKRTHHLSLSTARHSSLPVGHRPRPNATPDATVRPVTAPAAPVCRRRGHARCLRRRPRRPPSPSSTCRPPPSRWPCRPPRPRRRTDDKPSRARRGPGSRPSTRTQRQGQRQALGQARPARDAGCRHAARAAGRADGCGDACRSRARRPRRSADAGRSGSEHRAARVAAPGQRREEGRPRDAEEQGPAAGQPEPAGSRRRPGSARARRSDGGPVGGRSRAADGDDARTAASEDRGERGRGHRK